MKQVVRILAVRVGDVVRIPHADQVLLVPVCEVNTFAELTTFIAAKHAFNARRAQQVVS